MRIGAQVLQRWSDLIYRRRRDSAGSRTGAPSLTGAFFEKHGATIEDSGYPKKLLHHVERERERGGRELFSQHDSGWRL